MPKIVSISLVAVILLGFNFLLYQRLPNNADIGELKNNLNKVEQQSANNTSTNLDIEEPNIDEYKSLVEIELKPSDIRSSELGSTLGVNEPFNNQFISEDDVIDSIQRIMGNGYDVKSLDDTLEEYVISLRNMEMLQGIDERNSQVPKVIEDSKDSNEVPDSLETLDFGNPKPTTEEKTQ